MTLVLACVSPDYLIVVADQRLREWSSSGAPGTISDGANKVVSLGLHSVFSYAGVGRLGGQTVDRWTADRLARRGEGLRSIPFIDAVEEIRLGATQWFRDEAAKMQLHERNRLRHTFVGVGLMPGDARETRSALAVISNAAGAPQLEPQHSGGVDYRFQWGNSPSEEFTSSILDPQSLRGPVILPIGSGCSQARGLLKVAHRAARSGRSMHQVRSILEEAIREVAKSNENVGPDVTTVACHGVVTPAGAGLVVGALSKGSLVVMGQHVEALEWS